MGGLGRTGVLTVTVRLGRVPFYGAQENVTRGFGSSLSTPMAGEITVYYGSAFAAQLTVAGDPPFENLISRVLI